MCDNLLSEPQMDFAVFVVHAHESRFSINERWSWLREDLQSFAEENWWVCKRVKKYPYKYFC